MILLKLERIVRLGDNTIIHSNVSIGYDVKIGNNCIIESNVAIYNGCIIGDNVIIHSGTVIGSDGFGFAKDDNGKFKKIPQNGIVKIENDVEIGSNCTIDRATIRRNNNYAEVLNLIIRFRLHIMLKLMKIQ